MWRSTSIRFGRRTGLWGSPRSWRASPRSIAQVTLGASGGSAAAAQKKQAAQKWVMLNVDMGDSWAKTNLPGRYGQYVEVPLAAGHGNPKVLKMFYFPSIDMTFMVNVGNLEVWRTGRASY